MKRIKWLILCMVITFNGCVIENSTKKEDIPEENCERGQDLLDSCHELANTARELWDPCWKENGDGGAGYDTMLQAIGVIEEMCVEHGNNSCTDPDILDLCIDSGISCVVWLPDLGLSPSCTEILGVE